MLLRVPPGVESLIVQFVSTGDDGIEAVLNLRRVCKTIKEWVDNLPREQARRVFSKAFVSTRIDQVTEDYVTSLSKFPPPVELTTLHLTVIFQPNHIQKDNIHLEKFFDLWCSRVESISLELYLFRLHNNEHARLAKIINDFLENSHNLREIHFDIHSLLDLFVFKEFFMNRKCSDEIRITLTFREKNQFENQFLPVAECLRSILISIFEKNSIYTIIVKDEYILGNIKSAAGNDTSVYMNFLKIITHLECSKQCEHILHLGRKYFGLEVLTCGKQVCMEYLQIPETVKTLKLRRNPYCTLPEVLSSFHLDRTYCSGPYLINLMLKVENECPNLITLNVNWTHTYQEHTNAIAERTGRPGFFSKFI